MLPTVMATSVTAVAGSSTRLVNTNATSTATVVVDRDRQDEDVGTGFRTHPDVAGGDQREHHQRDHAADRSDRTEIEEHREQRCGDGGGDQAEGGASSDTDPITGGNCRVAVISSQRPFAGYSPALVAPDVAKSAVTVIIQ